MKKWKIKNNIFLLAKKSEKDEKKLDYYLQMPTGKNEYAFTRKYSSTCYNICKSGIPLHDILHRKKKNTAFMEMVEYLNFMMPYFIEYYCLLSD